MILKPTKGPQDWKEFLAKPDLHWKPGRSAMETALSWESAKGLPAEVASLFGRGAELLLAIPEYKVALPGGSRDSQNDVFALMRTDYELTCCMIEAKRDEPFGPIVGDWLSDGSEGKKVRLDAIRALLGIAGEATTYEMRYQLLHRAASAVLTAQRFATRNAAMIVQSFSPEHRWFADFEQFAEMLGCSVSRGTLAQTHLPNGISLSLGWAACMPSEGEKT